MKVIPQTSENLIAVEVTIPIGQSLSETIPTWGMAPVGIVGPAAWEATTARVNMLAALTADGTPVAVQANGTQISFPANSAFESLAGYAMVKAPFLAFQAVATAGALVAQATAARTFTVLLRKYQS